MADLLFEIGTEELPSWYVSQGREALAAGIGTALAEARLPHGPLRAFATPRRLAVIVEDVADASERRTEKRRGPPERAAFDADGRPTRAAVGFAETNGVDVSELTVEDTDRGRYLFATLEAGGTPATEILRPVLRSLVLDLPAPRKMRWGDGEAGFVRPVAWLVALLGGEVVDLEVAGQRTGNRTRGHRFLAPDEIELGTPDDYLPALRAAYVLADLEARREATWEAVCAAAAAEGLEATRNDDLLDEVTNLVEAPFAVLGSFDDDYLVLPDEVLETVMIHHQRYFPLRDRAGRLAARFVSVSNNRVPDTGVIRQGYERVLAGRLYDARFFWNSDREKTLSQHAWSLSGIQFHSSLGSMAEKVSRVGETALRLADVLALGDEERSVLERALPVFRADLGTGMVFEFPELEGVMARAYALAEGQHASVAAALEGGVRPKGPEDALPATTAGAVLSVADRLDKLVGFHAAGKRASGSADPFGLRRDALGLVRVLNARGWSAAPRDLLAASAPAFEDARVEVGADLLDDVEDFLWDRVASLLAEEGIGVHVVRAAVADGPAVTVAARRAHLLRAMSAAEEFPAFMTLFKRAANLAERAPIGTEIDPALFSVPEEAPLYEALPVAREGIAELVRIAEDALEPWDLGRGPGAGLPSLGEPLSKVLRIKQPLDDFLDNVLVMVEDEAVRDNRLALLREVRDALRALGTLEELEGI